MSDTCHSQTDAGEGKPQAHVSRGAAQELVDLGGHFCGARRVICRTRATGARKKGTVSGD
jgi:hypothetical protein